jgi:uncharacterized protein
MFSRAPLSGIGDVKVPIGCGTRRLSTNLEFLIADASKVLDQAREAAIADARRKAELYARASGVSLGRVAWITEGEPPLPLILAKTAPVPIEPGEDTLRIRVTVGFDISR